jgi:hypothetical protein
MNNTNQNVTCKTCKHFFDPAFGFPMCRKLKTDTTKDSKPKRVDCYEAK